MIKTINSIYTSAALACGTLTCTFAQDSSDLPLGLEAVTGTRSEYIDRGFKKAQQILDFQLEGEATLSDGLYLGYGAWYATSTGKDDFSETGTKLTLSYHLDSWQWNNKVIYRDLNQSVFSSGLELTSELSYFFSESARHSHALKGLVSYDTGADGFYGAIEYATYQALNEDAFFAFQLGVSATSDYYGVDGANDLYSRLSFTYNLTQQVSLTPFVFTSIDLEDNGRSDSLGAGLWFEMSF